MADKIHSENNIELRDLVYAPLKAISDANIQLSSSIVDFLASTGDMGVDSSGKPAVTLRTIQMLYDQIRYNSIDNPVSECISLEVPLLSIYPLSSLKVSKTKISFNAEIKNIQTSGDDTKIFTQVCSKKQRESANAPFFSYEVELDSAPIPEGLARFIDTLNAQAIPKKIHSTPVDKNGKKLSGDKLKEYEEKYALKKRERELNGKLTELRDRFYSKNNELKTETGMNFDEYTVYMEGLENPPETLPVYGELKRYNRRISHIEEKLEEIRQKLLMNRISNDDCSDADIDSYEGNKNSNENKGADNPDCYLRDVPGYCVRTKCPKLQDCDYARSKSKENKYEQQ